MHATPWVRDGLGWHDWGERVSGCFLFSLCRHAMLIGLSMTVAVFLRGPEEYFGNISGTFQKSLRLLQNHNMLSSKAIQTLGRANLPQPLRGFCERTMATVLSSSYSLGCVIILCDMPHATARERGRERERERGRAYVFV